MRLPTSARQSARQRARTYRGRVFGCRLVPTLRSLLDQRSYLRGAVEHRVNLRVGLRRNLDVVAAIRRGHDPTEDVIGAANNVVREPVKLVDVRAPQRAL